MATSSTSRTGILILLISLLSLSYLPAQTLQDYHVEMDEGVITKFLPTSTYGWNIVVPETLQEQTVIGIADATSASAGVFYYKMFNSISFPHTLQFLGDYSFYDSYLKGFNFTNCTALTRIGDYVAYSTSLTSISLQGCTALETIGKYAFAGNNAILSTNLSNCSSLQEIKANAFYNNTNNASLTLANCSNLTTIEYRAFYNNKITTIDLSGCTAIEKFSEACFRSNGFTTLDFTTFTNLQSIDYQAFAYNGLTDLNLSGCQKLTTIGNEAFANNQITNLNLSQNDSLTYIGTRAFYYNSLSSIDLSACTSLTYIGEGAFYGNSLTSFQLPIVNGMEALGWMDSDGNTYNGGDVVTNLNVSYYVPAIYTLTDDDVEVVDGTITSCSYNFALKNIVIPATLDGQTVTSIADATSTQTGIFALKDLASVTFPTTLEKIGDFAFYENLISAIDFSPLTSLTHIGEESFAYNLYSTIDLSDNTNLVGIGDGAFYCRNLTSVNIISCNSLLSIGSYAFGYDYVPSLTLPTPTGYEELGWRDEDGNIHVAGSTVTDLYSSYKVPVPYTLTDEDVVVENGIIVSCSYNYFFQDIIIPGTLDGQTVIDIADKTYNTGVFYQHDLLTVQLPSTIQKVGEYAFYESNLISVDLSYCTSLDSINEAAFSDCEITKVNFSGCSQLSVIGYEAFDGNQIDTIDLSSCTNLEVIEPSAFYYNGSSYLNLNGCSNLKRIDYSAFSDNYFSSLDLSSCTRLEYIGENAMYSSSLTGFNLPVNSEYSQYGWRDDNNNIYQGGDYVENEEYAMFEIPIPYTLTDEDVDVENGYITNCTYTFERKDIIIPEILDGQQIIGIANGEKSSDGVFYYKGIKSVVFPPSIKVIGKWAFYDNDLSNLNFTNFTSLDTIGEASFYYNQELSEMSLKGCSNLKIIGRNAFYDCTLDSVNFTGCSALEIIDEYAFRENNILSLDFSNCTSLRELHRYSFEGNQLFSVNFSGCTSLQIIDYDSFNDNDISNLNFTGCDSLSEIGSSAFSYNNLTSLDLSPCNSLTKIDQSAFSSNKLTSVDFSGCKNLKSIGQYAFQFNSLPGIDLSPCTSLTSIAAYAFRYNSFSSFVLPSPVIPGFIIETWKDAGGTLYPVGSTVSNLNTSYTANLTEATLVNFWVSDGFDPIEGANIQLSNIGTATTNQEGLAQFSTTTKDSLNYTASAPGYLAIHDSISALDTFVEEYVVLNLCTDTVKLVESLCEGESFAVGDSSYTKSGIYQNIFTNQAGCDSVILLDLTVNPVYSLTIYDTICSGSSSALGDTSYTETGSYSETFSSVSGCDSTITLHLTAYSQDTITLISTICDYDSVIVGTSVYTQTGFYSDTLVNQLGCDSIIHLDLTVNSSDSVQLHESICEGEVVQIGDSTYYLSGIYINKLSNKYGCDSVVTLDLTVNPVYDLTIYDTLCARNSSILGDTSYTETGIYSHTFTTVEGCDSVVTLELMVYPYDSITIDKTICEGDYYLTADSTKLYDSGIYWENLTNRYGCDSVVDIHLTVIPKETHLTEVICEGDAIIVGESVYTQTGLYSDTLTNRLGCDSMVTLNLTVIPEQTNLTVEICDYDSVTIGTSVYRQTGIFADTLFNRLGCDSIINLDLTVNRSDSILLQETICQGESYQMDKFIYDTTGIYTNTFSNQFGCDSVVSLNLTVNPVYQFITDEEICEGDEYLFQGNYYNLQGTYVDTFTTQHGCDSIYVLNLTVHPSDRRLYRDTINYGDTYTFREKDYTESGLYSDTLTNVQGCDSIISLLLYVYHAPTVYIPDILFKAELLSDTLINTNKDDEIQVTEATAYSGKVNVSGKNIERFTGIEAFVNIDTFMCSNNLSDSLDLSLNKQLLYLDCSDNSLTWMDISKLSDLLTLNCAGNQLAILETSANDQVERIDCSNNALTNLDCSSNSNLVNLDCSNNQLQTLNLRNGNNENLTILATGNAYLTCVTVDDVNYANANWTTNFDPGITFSTDCASPDIAVTGIQFNPGTVYPEDSLLVSWKVVNYGNQNAVGGWNERISLVSGTNQQIYLNGNLVVTETLPGGDTIRRDALLEIPTTTQFSGPAKVMVELIPTGLLQTQEEITENNKLLSDSSVIIEESFYFKISESSVSESYSGNIRCSVTRSGNSDSTLLVTLQTLGTDINLPPTVAIAAGNNSTSFYLTVNDNNEFDGLRLVEITALAPGFNPKQASIEIEDDDIPHVWVKLPNDIFTEGETINAIIETNLITDSSQYFNLSTNKSSQWNFNSLVVIPAQDSTVELQIDVTDDFKPELNNYAIITVAAKGYTSTGDTAFILDDDIPQISIALVEDTISEAAGNNATWLTITRGSDNEEETVSVTLETNNTNDIELSNLVHFFPGEMEKQVSIDMVDNDQVDGERTATIFAAVYIPSCYCNSISSGTDTTTLLVSDNDGPSLSITCEPGTLLEGVESQGTLTVTRNTPTEMALLVYLTSNNPGELLLQDTVTIPAGSSSVDIPVTAVNDYIDDGLQVATVRASATGFASGTVNVYTSDQNKPDLIVSSFTPAESKLPIGSVLEFQATIKNTGFLKAPAGFTANLYLSSDNKLGSTDKLLQSFTLEASLAIGDSVQIWDLVNVPANLGNYYLLLKVNPNETLTELLYTNNTSKAVPFEILSNYSATAVVDEATFTSAQPVTIYGSAMMSDSTAAVNKTVEVYVITQGIRRIIDATTNDSGEFSATFEPYDYEIGHYIVGACYPGENSSTIQDEFDILGFGRTSNDWLIWYIQRGETITGSFSVKNYSNAALTNLNLNIPSSTPAGFSIDVNTISVLEGNGTATFNFSVTGSQVTEVLDYIQIPIQITCDQGVSYQFTALYFCQAIEGLLKAEPVNLETSFTKGKIRYIEFYVYNVGAGNSGEVSISLPDADWMSLASPATIENIESGDYSKVTLRLQSVDETPLNYPMTGQIAINATNSDGLFLPYRIECVSEETGNLLVDVVDEYTYSTEEGPHLADAHVKVSNPYTGEVVGEGYTNSDGQIDFSSIPEGNYVLLVEADNHDGSRQNITINPGQTTEKLVFISFQAITYTWTVVPTEIEDEYEIVLKIEYETNVPKPVVTLDIPTEMPDLEPGETFAFMATLTNHGLITAEEVDLSFPTDDAEYEFVFQDKKYNITAQESLQIPVVMQRKDDLKSSRITTLTSGTQEAISVKCYDVSGYEYGWQCGPDKKYEMYKKPYKYRRCDDNNDGDDEDGGDNDGSFDDDMDVNELLANIGRQTPIPVILGGMGIALPGLDGFVEVIAAGSGTSGYDPTSTDFACEPCLTEIAKFAVGKLIPGSGLVLNVSSCFDTYNKVNATDKEVFDCLLSMAPTAFKEELEKQLSLVGDINSLINIAITCYGDPPGMPLKSATEVKPDMPPLLEQAVQDLMYVQLVMEARMEWLDEFWGPIDWKSKENLSDLAEEISVFVSEHQKFSEQDILNIKQILVGTDISADDIEMLTRRWNNTIDAWNDNIYSPTSLYPDILDGSVADYCIEKSDSVNQYLQSRGFTTVNDLFDEAATTLDEQIADHQNSVCASVTLSISQKLVMTREAFRGTLTMKNGHETLPIEEFQLNLEITNENGELCNDLFEIETEALSQLTGIDGTGTLSAMETGTATILFIPERGAAPTITTSYSFGGSITYLDPFTSTTVTKTLFPVTLEVHPSPDLYLHYFMQRDILGDDPLTVDITEPVIPGELALMIENNGYGDANNVLIESAQPEIVDNEKGLLIDFELIGSNLQGLPVNLGLINIDFGTIFAQSTKVGQWWFTSSLLGHFVDYSASLTHTDSRGNPELSLVSGAEMHELIRSISVYGNLDDGINDFLVNDVQDVKELPDAIYLSQGQTVLDVYEATNGSFDQMVQSPTFTNTLTLSPRFLGWNYLKLDDPGNGMFEIVSVTRNNDGQEIPLDNAWLTYITMPDGQEHVYENKFHIVDDFETMTAQTYTVVWAPSDTAEIQIVEITGTPAQPITTPLSELTVVFNKKIDPLTFTYQDLIVKLEGSSNLADNSIQITKIDDFTYTMDISALTTGDGAYELTVNTANISDDAGNGGNDTETVTWTQLLSVPAIEEFSGIASDPTNQVNDAIQLRFNMEIDPTTFSSDDLTLYQNSGAVAATLSVSQVDGSYTTFLVEGISGAITEDAIYQLLVDLDGVRSLTGIYGKNQQYVEWTFDSTPPEPILFAELSTNKIDEQHVPGIQVSFSESINDFTKNDFELWKNNVLLSNVNMDISMVSPSIWNISGFDTLTYGEGTYTFKILADQLSDLAGNSGVSVYNSYSWNVDRTPPPSVTNLAIVPDLGSSNSDGITSGDSISVSMIVHEDNTTIFLYETDGNSRSLLSQVDSVDSGLLVIPADFSASGNVSVEIVCTDSVGNQSTTSFKVYLDNTDLLATISEVPTEISNAHPDSLIVTFSEAIEANDFNSATLSIQYNGAEILSDPITIQTLDSKRFVLKGFENLLLRDGVHTLFIDLSMIRKLSSGKTGSSNANASWEIQIPNSYPVANAGADSLVRQGQICQLNGLATYDPDGDPLTYKWYYPSSLILLGENTLTPSFVVPFDKIGTIYTLMLSASDGELTHTDKTIITINQAIFEDTISVTICSNESYQLGSLILNEPGTYIDTLPTMSGADSIVHLNLFVNPVDSVVIDSSICVGESIVMGDSVYSETGVYITTFINQLGCDSIVALNLTMNQDDSTSITQTICEGEQVAIGDSVYFETGVFVTTLSNQLGCDSVVTLDLMVNPTDSKSLIQTICEGEKVAIGDSVYSETGVFVTTLSNQLGCDSVVTLDLTVNPIDSKSLIQTICEGEQVSIGDSTYSETGVFVTTLSNQLGCDSVVTLDLTVNPTDSTSLIQTICEGEQVVIGDSTYSETGVFVTTLSNQLGCDSVVTLDLTVNPTDSTSLIQTICEGEQVVIGDSVYYKTGIFATTLRNQMGCDSFITLELTVNKADSTSITETICEGEQVAIGDSVYSETGIFATTLRNQMGCDSVVTLELNVYPLDTTEIKATICHGETYFFNGSEYDQSGTYSETYSSVNGCDSTMVLQLTVLPEMLNTMELDICIGDTYVWGDSTYSETGEYQQTFVSQEGCDSTVILKLNFVSIMEITYNMAVCEGESFIFRDSSYSNEGSYTEQVENPSGCDSVFTLNLKVYSPDEIFISDTIAFGTSYQLGNNQYDTTGTYTVTLVNIHGCDSIVHLDLTVLENHAPVVINPMEDIDLEVGDSVNVVIDLIHNVFYDEDGDQLSFTLSTIPNESEWMETILSNGLLTLNLVPALPDTGCYQVVLEATDPWQESVQDSFEICVAKKYDAIGEVIKEKPFFQMYPNPTSGRLNIGLNYPVENEIEILMYNNMGRNVLRQTYRIQNEKVVLDVSEYVSGIYLITIRNGQKHYTRKLIINRKK